MKSTFALIVCIVLTACSKNKLHNTIWTVVDDTKSFHHSNYRSVYRFTEDSLKMNFLASPNKIEIGVKYVNHSIIIGHQLPELVYRFKSDTLFLKWPETTLKLLPFNPIVSEQSPAEFKSELMNAIWSFEYGGNRFEAIFLNEDYGPNAMLSEMQLYRNNGLEHLFELPLWNVESLEGQLLLVMEDPYENYYPTVFFINEVIDPLNFRANTWFYGEEYEVLFSGRPLPESHDLEKMADMVSGQWEMMFLEEKKNVTEYDSTIINLGTIVNFLTPIDQQLVVKEDDLLNHDISFDLLPDSTFQLLKRQKVISEGRWKLLRNGRTVELEYPQNFSEDYDVSLDGFVIKDLSEDELEIEVRIPVYENDSTIPVRNFEFRMSRML